MVNFLRCCVGIILWMFLPQIPLLASEIPPIHYKARDLINNSLQNQPNSAITIKPARNLITQERQGEVKKFAIPVTDTNLPAIPIDQVDVIEVIADRQEYDQQRQVITAEGMVVMRFAQSVMTSDRLEINLADRIAVAQGNVVLKRGEHVLRGDKFEYYLVADRGIIFNAGGEIYQPSLNQDTDLERRLAPESTILDRALSDRLLTEQPLTNVTGTTGLEGTIGSTRDIDLLQTDNPSSGTINRLRFQAERVDFEADTWSARNLRLTNDPFSPPELELKSETATFQRLDTLRNKLSTTKSRVVIDDSVSIPLLASGFVFDGRPSQPGLLNLGFDGEERGGFYIERTWRVTNGETFNWEITPQYFLQRALFPTTFRFSESEEG
ncbi:MAG: DUF3769 domain-containing protein, partial [Waterburya sp.]